MIDEERELRVALRGLLRAPVPPVPKLEGRVPSRPSARWLPLVAAAAMVSLLAASLFHRASDPDAGASVPISARFASVEERIVRLDDARLRSLLLREVELLRRELEVARK